MPCLRAEERIERIEKKLGAKLLKRLDAQPIRLADGTERRLGDLLLNALEIGREDFRLDAETKRKVDALNLRSLVDGVRDAIELELSLQIIDEYEAFQSGLPLDQQTRDLTAPEKSIIRLCRNNEDFEGEPTEKAFALANWNLRQIREAAAEFGLSGKWADSLMTQMSRFNGAARLEIIPAFTTDRAANRGYALRLQLLKLGKELTDAKREEELGAVLERYEAFQETLPAEQRRPDLNKAETVFVQQCEQQAEALGETAETGLAVANWNLGHIRELGRAIKMPVQLRDELIKNPSLLPDITTTKIGPAPEDPGYDLYLRIMELGSQLMQN